MDADQTKDRDIIDAAAIASLSLQFEAVFIPLETGSLLAARHRMGNTPRWVEVRQRCERILKRLRQDGMMAELPAADDDLIHRIAVYSTDRRFICDKKRAA